MTITSYAKFFMTLALVGSLSACGGSSGSVVVTPPVGGGTTAAPDGSNLSSVIAFAKDGTQSDLGNGVTRYSNTQTIDGTKYHAWVDSLPGYGDALVSYQTNDQGVSYTLTGSTPTVLNAPAGVYTGQIEMSYKPGANGTWQVMTGNLAAQLDLTNGTVGIDSIASNANNTIEVLGTTTVSGSTFSAPDVTVRLRDGSGNLVKDYAGNVDGKIVTGDTNSAMFGTVGVNDPDGFQLNGGIHAAYDPSQNP